MAQHFNLMVQSIGAGVCIGLVVLVLSYCLDQAAQCLHIFFKP